MKNANSCRCSDDGRYRSGAAPHPDTVALLLKLGAPPLTPHPHEDILGLATPIQ